MARYGLLVIIETPEVNVDNYEPIVNQFAITTRLCLKTVV